MFFFDEKYCTKILQQICNAIVKDDLLLKERRLSNQPGVPPQNKALTLKGFGRKMDYWKTRIIAKATKSSAIVVFRPSQHEQYN